MAEIEAPIDGPLSGVTVLDLTQALSGPFATLLLAGMGATVVKIENPSGGDLARENAPYLGRDGLKLAREGADDVSIPFLNRNRNKRSVTLNLKHPGARAVMADLLAHADVLVENFSAGTAGRLGIDYEFARSQNPSLVYCSISGFGADGGGKAMDVIIQALSGLMMTSGFEDSDPVRVGLPIADLVASLFSVTGVLAALEQARRTGRGQHVDVSMLGALTSLVACEDFDVMGSLGLATRTGNSLPRLAPFGVYRAADAEVAVCAPSQAFAARLFAAMGRPDLLEDPCFRTRDLRVTNSVELDKLIGEWVADQRADDVVATLQGLGVPVARVRTPSEALRSEEVLARGEVMGLDHPRYGRVADVYGAGIPMGFSAAQTGLDRPAPELGADNADVYGTMLGYSPERLDELSARNVI